MKTTLGSTRILNTGVLGLLAVLVVSLVASPSSGAAPVPGSAGTDTSLAATDSQVTVAGRGKFADLRITVNQTKSLTNQAVSITWTGGTPTTTGSSTFDAHYLQVMQCWGDDDGTVPDSPGPRPEHCVQGASDAVFGGRNGGLFPSGGLALERIISRRGAPNFDPGDGHLDERTGYVWMPFRPVSGPSTDVHYDPNFNPAIVGGSYWLNPYFNVITTNEIAAGRTGPDGKGAELFEVNTGLESSGLGCGQKVQPVAGGSPVVPRCWLVVVPRGAAADENEGTGLTEPGVFTSPLSPRAWQHRIAIPLEFNPVDTPCALSDNQRRIVGSELVAAAVGSWQPTLCSVPGLPPYAYGAISDARARQQLLSPAPGSPGMAVVSRPIDPGSIDAGNPVTYAPLTLSAMVIGFNIERYPNDKDPAEAPLRGSRVAHVNLTPRLVAKLLTQSYRSQVAIKSDPPYPWVEKNPAHLGLDPDFLQFNPEFNLLQTAGGKNLGGLLMASPSSDAALQVWEWVLSDPEAKAWMDGAPDAWQMRVNPVYATKAAANSNGTPFGDPLPDTFPKSDPYCYAAPPQGPGGEVVPPLLCGLDWLPYTQTARDAARLTRAANDGARTAADPHAASPDKVYRPDGPQALGTRAILSITDSASAAQYGLQTASLSRAGDNGPERAFVAPDAAGLAAGVEAMAPKGSRDVLEPNPRATVSSAYPLTALTYAAVAPLSLDDRARREYAAFVDYAAGPGQVPGRRFGQLPPGYAPLPTALRAQSAAAAATIRDLRPASAPAEPASDLNSVPVAPTEQSDAPRPPSGAPVPTPGATRPPSGSSRSSRGSSSLGPLAAPPAAAVIDLALTAPSSNLAAGTPSPATKLITPVLALAQSRFALPGLFGIALLSALGALEITKRPRRLLAGAPEANEEVGS